MSLKNNPILKSYRIRVGITMGDPAGIGQSIISEAVRRLADFADFVVIGDKWVFNRVSGIGYRVSGIRFIDLDNVTHKNFKFGKIRAEYGRASIQYLDKALELIRNKEIDCLVTCPISKEAINLAGFRYSGHTEYLACKTNAKDLVMMLLNKELKVSLVTRHIPLRDIPLQLTKDKIYKTILLTYRSLRDLFLIKNARIVVCGLNPHASDHGLIGKEEERIILPALKKLRSRIKNIAGPKPSDIAMLEASQGKYDCVIAMYHDQALIALKLLNKDTGVNVTLGLPFIRTSPLHGTAFDIAGTNFANPDLLIEAIKLAVRCTLNKLKMSKS